MIKDKGIIVKENGYADSNELLDSIENLPDGEFGYLIFEKKKSKALPQLKYLFGYLLKEISEQLPDHPPVDALYRYFEDIFAPLHVCTINGEEYEFFNLKNEKSIEMNDVIAKIIRHAKREWGIDLKTSTQLNAPEATEVHANAYAEMWENYSRKI